MTSWIGILDVYSHDIAKRNFKEIRMNFDHVDLEPIELHVSKFIVTKGHVFRLYKEDAFKLMVLRSFIIHQIKCHLKDNKS